MARRRLQLLALEARDVPATALLPPGFTARGGLTVDPVTYISGGFQDKPASMKL